VSVATVDRVLNRRLPVRGDTAQRVVKAAEEIGYHATSLLKRRVNETPARRFGFLLQKRHDAFYQEFGQALSKATTAASAISGKAIVDFSEELVPHTIAMRLRELANKCDAVAVVAVDHPIVNGAVEEIVSKGKPVFTLLSDIASPQRASYLAVDSRKAGRTAAWTISRLMKEPGPVGILVGSHRYLSQEMSEISFRSFMREHAPHLQLLEPFIYLDDDRIAYEVVSNLLASTPNLAGLYISGGGQEGAIKALRESRHERHIVTVCNELTESTKTALIDGIVDLVLNTPQQAIAEAVVRLMIETSEAPGRTVAGQLLFPAELFLSENI
jgi:LacI family transcriptional regulator